MSMTYEQQSEILRQAASASGMDGHISEHAGTAAERVMLLFGGTKRQPRKNSYLYCNSVDACFYITDNNALCTFTAKWCVGSNDINKLADAGRMIKKMLLEMQRRIDSLAAPEQEATLQGR